MGSNCFCCVSDRSGNLRVMSKKHHKSHNKIDVMKDIDAVPSKVQSGRQEVFFFRIMKL